MIIEKIGALIYAFLSLVQIGCLTINAETAENAEIRGEECFRSLLFSSEILKPKPFVSLLSSARFV